LRISGKLPRDLGDPCGSPRVIVMLAGKIQEFNHWFSVDVRIYSGRITRQDMPQDGGKAVSVAGA
jgi:hypothetical protein